MSIAWSDTPIVFVVAPHCPSCGAMRPIIVRSEQGGDGSTSRRCVCRSCSSRFVVVVEPPECLPDFGRGVDDI